MILRTLRPRELGWLAQAGREALGPCFPGLPDLVAFRRDRGFVSGIVAGDEIAAAALSRLQRQACVARIELLASFLGDEEFDRRLERALVAHLEAMFWSLGAGRVEVFTGEDRDLLSMLRAAGYWAVPTDHSPPLARTLPRVLLVKTSPRHVALCPGSVAFFPHPVRGARVSMAGSGRNAVPGGQVDFERRASVSSIAERRRRMGPRDNAEDRR